MTGAALPCIGFATAKVTPAAKLRGLGVHDDLCARVLYLGARDGPALVLSLDHIGMSPGETAALKARLARSSGIPPQRTAFFFSHTHAGVHFSAGKLASLLARAAARARSDARPCQVGHLRLDAARRYAVNRRVEVGRGLGALSIIYQRDVAVDPAANTEDVGGQVRRFVRTGQNIWGSAYLLPENDPPWAGRPPSPAQAALLSALPGKLCLEGPVDPHLEWLGFRGSEGRWLGSIVRFAAHPVTWRSALTKMVSADYPGVLCASIESATGAPALFVNGPCGNVKPLFEHYGEDEMNRLGSSLARELLAAETLLQWHPLERARFLRRRERFQVHPDVRTFGGRWPTADASARHLLLAQRGEDPAAVKAALDWSLRCWGNEQVGWRRPAISLPFHLIAFNDLGLVGLPSEVWCEIGLSIEQACGDKRLMVGSLCDVVTNYVPVPGALRLGGYEAVNSMLEDCAGGRFVEVAADLVRGNL